MGITVKMVAEVMCMWNTGHSCQEIAAKLKLPEGIVKSIVKRK